MHIPEPMAKTAHEATEGAKEGMKTGARKLVGEMIENAMLLLGGAVGYRFFENREAKKRARELETRIGVTTDPEIRKELEREARELVEHFGGWGLVDETIGLSAFTRAAYHFLKIKESKKIKRLLKNLNVMSESNKDRFRRSLAKFKTEDERVEKVIQLAELSDEEQKGILNISNIELQPEEQAGLVLRTQFSAMSERVEREVSTDLEQRKKNIQDRRARLKEKIEAARKDRKKRSWWPYKK
jgi:hypothetical protein